jgi:hypothetical protein
MQFSTPTAALGFEYFISQDGLKRRRGQYAERYGVLSSGKGKVDVKFPQNLKIKNKNSLELRIDILNCGNVLNSD